MATTGAKISQLPEASPLNGSECVEIVQSMQSRRLFLKDITMFAPAYFQQAGTGSVLRGAQDKIREIVSPEDFGAVGDGVTDDTEAWQLAVSSGAKVVRGKQGSRYFINGQRVVWHADDLHRLGLVPAGAAIYSAGYWCGVAVPDGVSIENAHIIITIGPDGTKAHHAFAFGDPTSATRTKGNAIRNCRFEIDASFGGGSKRPRCFLAQSVDGFKFTDNRLYGFDATNEMVGGYLFDCINFDLSHNQAQYVELVFATEFCADGRINSNTFLDCPNMIDADKACVRLTICDNVYNLSAQAGAGTVDGVIEINGIDGLICTGNVINHSRAGIQYSVKGGVADSWAAALAGTAVATYYPSKNIISRNIVSNTDYYAIRVGGYWDSYTHDGVPGSSNVTLQDTIYNAYIQGGAAGDERAAILVNECDGFVFDGLIDGSGAHGIMLRTSLETAYPGAGTWSVLKATKLAGHIRNCAYRGLRSEACNELNFSGLYITDCGNSGSVMMETRSMHIKPAKVRGSVRIDRGVSTATIGWNISGGSSGTWDATTFSVMMESVIVKGAFDPTDGIRLSAQGTSAVSALPIIFRSAIIDKPDTPYFTEDGSRVYAGNPSGTLTPRFVGERVYDSTNKTWYIGTATAASTDWQRESDKQVIEGSVVYDPPSLADGAGATTTIAITGAALGDYVEVSFSRDLQGITLTGWVSVAGTVSVRFQNESGGVLDLVSGTLRVRVRKL